MPVYELDINGTTVPIDTPTELRPEQIDEIAKDIHAKWMEEDQQKQAAPLIRDIATRRQAPVASVDDAKRRIRNGDTNFTSMALRIGGGVGGALGGFLIAGPPGAVIGGVGGSALGDLRAQEVEIERGQRESVNLGRTALEAGLGAIPGGGASRPFLRGALFGLGTEIAEAAIEREEVPEVSQLAIAAGTGGLLNAAATKVGQRFVKQALDDLGGGTDEVYDAAEEAARQLELPGIRDVVDEPTKLVQAFADNPSRGPIPVLRATDKADKVIQRELPLGAGAPRNVLDPETGAINQKVAKEILAEERKRINAFKAAERRASKVAKKEAEREAVRNLSPQERSNLKLVRKQQRTIFGGDRTTTERLHRFFPTADGMVRIQERTGVSTFEDFARLNDKYHTHINFVDKKSGILQGIFKNTDAAKREQYTMWLEAENKGAVENFFRFSKQDKINARKLRGFYNSMFQEYGLDADRYLQQYAPRLRKYGDVDAAFPSGLPREVKFFADFMRGPDGTIDVRDTDALSNAMRYLREGSFQRHLGDDWTAMRAKYSEMKDSTVQEPFMRFLGTMRYNPSRAIATLDQAIDRISDRLSGASGDRVKIPKSDVESFVNEIVSLQYGGFLGFRPSSALRNALQPIQTTYPLLGWKYLREGFKQAATDTGNDIALRSGVLRGDVANIQALRRIPVGKARRALHALNDASLSMFQRVENTSRKRVYLGARQKALDAFRDAKGDIERFVDIGDIDRLAPPVQKNIINMLESNGIEAAADRYAKDIVEQTMFGYAQTERPSITTGVAGRFAGSFGVWPSSYASYFLNNLGPSAYGPKMKIRRDRARFLAGNAAILAGFSATGMAAGDRDSISDNLRWTFVNPIIFSGGPAIDLTKSAIEAAGDVASGRLRSGRSIAEFKKNVRNLIPGNQAFEDFRKASSDVAGDNLGAGEAIQAIPETLQDAPIAGARIFGITRGRR